MKLYPLSNQCFSWRISKFLYKQQWSVCWSYCFCKAICQMVLVNVYYWLTGQWTGFYIVGTSVIKELKSFEISFSILIGITFKYIILFFLSWSSPRNKHNDLRDSSRSVSEVLVICFAGLSLLTMKIMILQSWAIKTQTLSKRGRLSFPIVNSKDMQKDNIIFSKR